MVFLASTAISEKGYSLSRARIWELKQKIDQNLPKLDIAVPADVIISILSFLNTYKIRLTELRNTPGLEGFAQDFEDNPSYDILAEFDAILAKIQSSLDIIEGYPANTLIDDTVNNGWGLYDVIWNTFTPAQVAGLKAELVLLVALIV